MSHAAGLDERLAKTAEEREALEADLDRRLHRRDFDLEPKLPKGGRIDAVNLGAPREARDLMGVEGCRSGNHEKLYASFALTYDQSYRQELTSCDYR